MQIDFPRTSGATAFDNDYVPPAPTTLWSSIGAPSVTWNSQPQLPNRLNVGAPGVLTNNIDGNYPFLANVLSAFEATGPSHAAYFHLYPDGSYVYVPAEGYVGADSFTYRARDGISYSAPATVTIQVTDDAPVGVNDNYQVDAGDPLVVNDNGVLTNDSDPNGDPITAVLVSGPQHGATGSFVFNSDGTFQYKPVDPFPSDADGYDSFTYKTFDGYAYSALVTVTLTVVPQQNNDTIQLIKMNFNDAGAVKTHWDMYSDDGTYFTDSGWQWYDKNGNGMIDLGQGDHAWPVAYLRGSTMAVTAVFQLNNSLFSKAQAALQNGTLTIQGNTPTYTFTAKNGQISLNAGTQQLTITKISADTALPNIVTAYKNLTIDWCLSLDGTLNDTDNAGASVNPVYVLLNTPYLGNSNGTKTLYYTVVDLGCTLGWGLNDPNNKNALPNALMAGTGGFSGLAINTVRLNANTGLPADDGSDGDPTDPTGNPNFQSFALTYYGNWATASITTASLLKTHDGQCGAWATFFIDILAAQGAIGPNDNPYTSLQPTVSSITGNAKVGHEWLLVGDWSFTPTPNQNPYSGGLSVQVQQSSTLTAGQKGTLAPQSIPYPYMNSLVSLKDTPQNGMPVSIATSIQNGAPPFGYYWAGNPEVTYDYQNGDEVFHAQNNGDPYAIFGNHAVVKIGGKYYDPSYGNTYASLGVIDDQVIAGFAQTGTDANGNPVLYIRKNPPGRNLYEIVSKYGPTNNRNP